MNVNITNAASQVIHLGTLDSSALPVVPTTVTVSTHVPSVLGFGSMGPDTKEFLDGTRLKALYGSDTFDRTKDFFTHTTRLAEIVTGAGNSIMYTRIIPEDNKTIANTTLYLDVLKDTVNVYKRYADGSFAYDGNGDKVVDKTVEGYRLKLIAESSDTDDILTDFGAKVSKPGYMTDMDGKKSTMIPIIERRAKYKGKTYNDYGQVFSVPTIEDVDNTIITSNLALPYEFGMSKRADKNSTGYPVANIFGSNYNQFVFMKDAVDNLDSKVDFTSTCKKWYNLTNKLYSLVYPRMEKPYVYFKNLDGILEDLMVAEAEYVNGMVTDIEGVETSTFSWMDFVEGYTASEQFRLLNPFTAMSIKKVPNFTFYMDDSVVEMAPNHKEAYFSRSTPIYLDNGADGTLSQENLEKGVSLFMEKYLDPNSNVMSVANNLENVMYDSGFEIDTKKDLINFISLRKDTFLGLSTRVNSLGDDKVDTLVKQRAIGVSLKAALALAPESVFFNTSVARAIIVVGSGIDVLDPSEHRYPLLMDIVAKAAKMMGGTSWKSEFLFDRGGKNEIINYSDIEPKEIPAGVIADLWNIGLIWPQYIDRGKYCFPAMNSVYDIDSSALGNFFAGIALTITTKEADAVGRLYNGDMSLSPNEFIATIESELITRLDGKFGGILQTSTKARISDFDALRGYSYTVNTQLTGGIMKTVMIHYNEMLNNIE